ncbi:MAG: SpoIIIAC/SpoIIIAD family protein [Clostridia bacterium]|nr:SpoIIIAC/SpoIIIAD family protein [Clostridia bacterium]MDY5558429.1 SpoIIIAC/SpoIIIAD family protein [Candidatus Heritagella sp.]
MELFSIIGMGLIAAVVCLLLRKTNPEIAMLLSLAAGILLLIPAFSQIQEIFAAFQSISSRYSALQPYLTTLLKAAGICLLTQFAGDTCRDAGESSLANRIEFAGRISILGMAVPLMLEVLQMILGFMEG